MNYNNIGNFNEITIIDGDTVVPACVECAAGKTKSSVGNTACTQCTSGYFQNETGQLVCDECGDLSVPVTDSNECNCLSSAYEANKTNGFAVCLDCPINTFQKHENQKTCDPCPEHKLSPAGTESERDCRCKAGYFEPLPVGSACSECTGGTYKTYTSYDDYEVCALCPEHAHSGAASTLQSDCICNAGYYGPDGGPCEACPAGSFKAVNGSAACSVCPINHYQNLSASTACEICVQFSVSIQNSTSIEDCMCDTGVGRIGSDDNPSCVPCEPGEYEDYECLSCPGGKFTNSTRATKCFQCEDYSSTWSSESEDEPNIKCDCNPGYTTDSNASAPMCEACVSDTFKDDWGPADCTSCGTAQQSPAASVAEGDCSCNAGYKHEDELVCVACVSDRYQPETGKASCLNCPAHSHTLHNTSTALADCICDIGFSGPDGGACTACVPGSYKELAGNASCSSCPADQYQPATNAAACLQCHDDAFSEAGSERLENCKCNSGYTQVEGPACSACFAGKFSDPLTQLCINCSGGTFSINPGVLSCSVCPANSLSHEEPHVACQCDAGYVLDNATCVACAANYYKDHFGATDCQACQSNAQSLAASTTQGACQCNVGYAVDTYKDINLAEWNGYDQNGSEVCAICTPGTFSNYLHSPVCLACPPLTFAMNSGQSACAQCGPNSTVNANSIGCDCHPGFTIPLGLTEIGGIVVGAVECHQCAGDTYKDSAGNGACTACPSHSQSVLGAFSFEQCLCDEGYQRVGSECVACPVGTFKDHTNNSYPCASCTPDLTFSAGLGAAVCTVCTAVCADATPANDRHRSFAAQACNATHDVGCIPCTICAPGTYATDNSLCNDGRNRDRNDTQCATCPADDYCTGHTHKQDCPSHSHSPSGSVASTACVCVPGKYMTEDFTCEECPLDHYCASNTMTACPAHALTRRNGSSVLLDCTCRNGHYKNESSEGHFMCALCTKNDYCFNNSLYNCSDERMETEHGADSAADCRCTAGFYNNGTRCDGCPMDSFCSGGNITACAADRWTHGQTLLDEAEDCLCRPGLFGNENTNKCEQCPKNHFCSGNNEATHCPPNSSTLGYTHRHFCDCDIGFETTNNAHDRGHEHEHGSAYEHDHSDTISHGCQACQNGHYKDETGNTKCKNCSTCESIISYENTACLPASNRQCESCTTCGLPNFQENICTIQTDTTCKACTACNFDSHIETHPCNHNTQDTQCVAINFDHKCNTGSVAGNHSRHLQPTCLACHVYPSADPANTWYNFESEGAVYNDVHSCDIECLGLSELQNSSDHSLGCATCETGNALLRNIPGPGCAFTCRPGYALNAGSDDCELPVLRQVKKNTLPNMTISNWYYGNDGHYVTIAHTDTNRFIVLVGAREISVCEPHTCCYAGLVRVSTKHQMGITQRTAENCSRAYDLRPQKLSDTKIQFHIKQAELPTVGECTPDATGMVCKVVVTLLDVTFWRPISQTVRIHINTTASVLAFGVETKYLPLAAIRATVILVSRNSTSQLWQIAMYMPTDAEEWNVTMNVQGMTFYAGPVAMCGSYPGGAVLKSRDYTVANATHTTFISRWRSAPDRNSVSVLLHMHRGNAAMNVAVLRNMSGAVAQCQKQLPELQLATGEVRGVFGLGSAAVGRLRLLSGGRALPETGYGNAHRLATFVAEGTTVADVSISLERLLVVYLAVNMSMPSNVTVTRYGQRSFGYGFREWCRTHTGCEYEYIAQYTQRHSLLRVECTNPEAARRWIASSVGAHFDAGHVSAVCAQLDARRDRHAVAYLAVTGHVLSRATWGAGATTTHLFPAFRFSSNVT